MGKMKLGWDFPASMGFHGSTSKGMTQVAGYSRKTPKFAKGGAVPSDSKTGKSFAAAKIPTPTVGAKGPDLNIKFPGNHLAFAKGGHFEHEDSLPHESQAGYTHNEPEQGEHLEARRGGKVRKAKGGPVHSHFLESHKLHAHPDGIGIHHPHRGHTSGRHGPDHHLAPPHDKAGHKHYAAGGPIKKAMGGGNIARPTGMPRAPVIGMKRIRHAPGMPGAGQSMGRPQPGIPGMPVQGTPAMGQQPMKPRGMGGMLGTMGGMGGMKRGGHRK